MKIIIGHRGQRDYNIIDVGENLVVSLCPDGDPHGDRQLKIRHDPDKAGVWRISMLGQINVTPEAANTVSIQLT